MAIVIVLYDQFLFRPIVAWADKFRVEHDSEQDAAALVALRSRAPHRLFSTVISP